MDDVFPKVVIPGVVPIRDTVISTWFTMAVILAGVLLLRRYLPRALDAVVGFVVGLVHDVAGRGDANVFVPLIGALAIFIAVSNIIGVVPLVQTPTKDINTPLALALIVFFAVHYFGVRQRGVLGYLKTQASPLVVLEIISQVSRTMSLTLRLFGNVVSGEMVVAVIFNLVKPIAPLPMMGLSMFTGVLQAYIFTILAMSYISAAVHIE